MASTLMHLAVAEVLIKRYKFKDEARFKLGEILPDAGEAKKGHLKVNLDDGSKIYDFERFRAEFGDLILKDDLYLGYYFHLIQDVYYRHFVYDIHHWNPHIDGNVDRLHNDYAILNKYVVAKYCLKNSIRIPDGFENERINKLCCFNTQWLIEATNEYFTQEKDGEIFFFTKEMADEFVELAVEACAKELEALRSGGELIDGRKHAYLSK